VLVCVCVCVFCVCLFVLVCVYVCVFCALVNVRITLCYTSSASAWWEGGGMEGRKREEGRDEEGIGEDKGGGRERETTNDNCGIAVAKQ
jgi:hypothetical protein